MMTKEAKKVFNFFKKYPSVFGRHKKRRRFVNYEMYTVFENSPYFNSISFEYNGLWLVYNNIHSSMHIPYPSVNTINDILDQINPDILKEINIIDRKEKLKILIYEI